MGCVPYNPLNPDKTLTWRRRWSGGPQAGEMRSERFSTWWSSWCEYTRFSYDSKIGETFPEFCFQMNFGRLLP